MNEGGSVRIVSVYEMWPDGYVQYDSGDVVRKCSTQLNRNKLNHMEDVPTEE